jgi:hypothetical protein
MQVNCRSVLLDVTTVRRYKANSSRAFYALTGCLWILLAISIVFPSQAFADFTQVTSGSGVTATGTEIAVEDFDADGDLDFTTSDHTNQRVYSNNGDLTFAEVAPALGLTATEMQYTTWGDYDNDGDIDIAFGRKGSAFQVHIFRNDAGTFTEAIVFSTVQIARISWVDFDLDGDLDMFAGYIFSTSFELHRNNLKETGSATFTNVASSTGVSGLDAGGSTVGSISWADIDNDGDPDAYVATRPGRDKLLLNQLKESGTATFVDNHAALISFDITDSITSPVWGDYDNDGDLDLFQSNRNGGTDKLYRNELVETGSLSFTDVTVTMGVSGPGDIGGVGSWVDFDNDGDLDLYSGSPGTAVWALYRNELVENGSVGFTEVSGTELGAAPAQHQGVIFFDADGDGYQDFLLPGNGFSLHLYENNGSGNNWLQVDLEGTISSKDALHARVRAVAGGRSLIREVSGSSIYGNTGVPKRLHFGLGSSSTVDSLIVSWPSGFDQIWTGVSINQVLALQENANDPPAVVASLTDTILVVGQSAYLLDIEAPAVFSDPDGDTMTYSVSSDSPGSVSATISGTTITVSAISSGTALVVVTADDGNGETVADTMSVISNAAPSWSAFPDTLITIGLDSLSINLGDYAQDGDDSSLIYSASNPSPATVTIAVSGDVLTVVPIESGTVTLTVTADDGRNGLTSLTFQVVANQAPQLDSIPDKTLTIGQDTLVVDLDTLVVDESSLSYSATTSDESVAMATVQGSVLNVVPLVSGSATITVVVDDGSGGTTQGTFVVVTNQAPTITKGLPDVRMPLGTTITVPVDSVFVDFEGDSFALSVRSTDSLKAIPTLIGQELTVTASDLRTGAAGIFLLAIDARGGATEASFRVDVDDVVKQLTFVPDKLSFDGVLLGVAVTDSFVVGNTGNISIVVSSLVPGDSAFTTNQESMTLEPGAESTVVVTYSPVRRDTIDTNLVLTLASGGTELFALSGWGLGPRVDVSLPDTLDLGSVGIGSDLEYSLRLENSGESQLSITGSVTGAGFSVTPDSLYLAPSEADVFLVTFSPVDTAISFGELTLISNDPASPQLASVLVATGSEIAVPILSPTFIDFGPVLIGQALSETLTFENTRSADVSITVSSSDTTFSVSPFSSSIAPGDIATIELVFTPIDTVARDATIAVAFGTDSLTVAVTGFGKPESIASPGDGYTLKFEETFEGTGAAPGWQAWNPDKDAQAPSLQAVSFSGGMSGLEVKNDFGVYRELPESLTGQIVMELWVDPRIGSDTNFSIQLLLDDGSEDGITYRVLEKNETDRWFYTPAGGGVVFFRGVEPGGYDIRVVYDTELGEYSLSFDENGDGTFQDLALSEVRSKNGVEGYPVKGIYLHSGRGAIGTPSYIDDLRFYAMGPAPRLEETFEGVGVAPGWQAWNPAKDAQVPVLQMVSFRNGMSGLEVKNDFGVYRELPNALIGKIAMELWVDPRIGSDTNFSIQFLLDDGNGDGITYSILGKNETDRWFYSPSGGGSVFFRNVESGGYFLRVEYDTEVGEYSLFFDENRDGEFETSDLVLEGVRSRDGVVGYPVKGIYFHSGRGGRGTPSYVDDLRIFGGNIMPVVPEETPLVVTANFDGDSSIGFGDFLIFAAGFGVTLAEPGFDARLDLDADGAVGFSDFLLFASVFGQDV